MFECLDRVLEESRTWLRAVRLATLCHLFWGCKLLELKSNYYLISILRSSLTRCRPPGLQMCLFLLIPPTPVSSVTVSYGFLCVFPRNWGDVCVAGTALASKAIEAMRHLGCDEVSSRFNIATPPPRVVVARARHAVH